MSSSKASYIVYDPRINQILELNDSSVMRISLVDLETGEISAAGELTWEVIKGGNWHNLIELGEL